MERNARIPRSRKPITVEDDQMGDQSSYSISTPGHPGGNRSLTLRKPKSSLTVWTHFQPVTDPTIPTFIDMVDVALRSNSLINATKANLTNPNEVQEAIRDLKDNKAPGPNGITNRALKHLPQRAVFLLVQYFNAVLLTHHFTSVRNYARMISILKPGKNPAHPSSYRPIVSWTRLAKYLRRYSLLGSYF